MLTYPIQSPALKIKPDLKNSNKFDAQIIGYLVGILTHFAIGFPMENQDKYHSLILQQKLLL
jgi:hypothetical protein